MTAETKSAPSSLSESCFEGFPSATMGCVYGPSGTGKSYLLLHLAICKGCGHDPTGGALPAIENPGPVTFLSNDPEDVIRKGIHTISTRLPGAASATAARNLKFIGMGIKDFYLGTPRILPLIKNLAEESDLLILDPITRFITGRRCDVGEMRKNLFDLERIARNYSCNILFSHSDPSSHTLFAPFTSWHCTMNTLTESEVRELNGSQQTVGHRRYKRVDIDCSFPDLQRRYLYQGEGGFLQAIDTGTLSPFQEERGKDHVCACARY